MSDESVQDSILPETSMEFYRSTAAGIALTASLNSLLEAKEISLDDAKELLYDFDSTVELALRKNLCTKKKYSVLELEGKLDCYNNLHDLWKIDATEVTSTMANRVVSQNKRVRLMFSK